MAKLIFIWWLLNGTITPAGEHENHKMYTLWFKEENKVCDYMYRGEIIHYIETGKLEYDDFYEWKEETE